MTFSSTPIHNRRFIGLIRSKSSNRSSPHLFPPPRPRGRRKKGVERLERLERFEPVHDLAIRSLTILAISVILKIRLRQLQHRLKTQHSFRLGYVVPALSALDRPQESNR